MRGVRRDDREEIENLLRNGVAPVIIAKERKVPLSTVTTWLKILRKEKKEKIIFSSKRVEAIYTAKTTNSGEARIMTIVTPYLYEDITENEFFNLEKMIAKELKSMASDLC